MLLICDAQSQVIDTVCPGEINVNYAVNSNPGSTYQWTLSGGVIKSGNGTSKILVDWKTQTGLYRISVIEKNIVNCVGNEVVGYVLINGNNFLVNYPPEACKNDTILLSGLGGDKYLWSNGDTNSSILVKLIQDTTFILRISSSKCSIPPDTFYLKVKASASPVISFTPDGDDFYKDKLVNFKYLGNAKDLVSWQFDKSMVNKIVGNSIQVTFIDTGQAWVKLYAVNGIGCTDSLSRMFNIKDENMYLPNAFTPNGDGLNDVFIPVSHGIKSMHLVIFNRWGEVIFVSDSMHDGWNGTFNGSALSSDVFGFTVEAIGYSGKYYFHKGTVTLLR